MHLNVLKHSITVPPPRFLRLFLGGGIIWGWGLGVGPGGGVGNIRLSCFT